MVFAQSGGAALVIDNADNAAISQTGSGYIQSEGATNRVIWTIGAGNSGNYVVPFGNAATFLPLRFSAASGSGATGQIVFSTYPTATWKNSDFLPPGVTNVNAGSSDNSAKVIDRFWQVAPQGYTTKPTLTNLSFAYSDLEYAAPNTITEGALIAQRWNNVLKRWDDFIPASTINTSANTVNVASIAGSQLFDWWTLVDASSPLPVTLVYFKAVVQNRVVLTSWQTATEHNSDHFEVWRSKDAVLFEPVGNRQAAGNSTSVLNYTLTDGSPYSNISYYKLKSVDRDARFTWSATVSVRIDDAPDIFLYPNPATTSLTISSSADLLTKRPVAFLYDSKGSLLQKVAITSASQQVNTTPLPAGAYRIQIRDGHEVKTLSFIKK